MSLMDNNNGMVMPVSPRPAYVVQNPNCCQQTFGCGCGAA